MDTLAQCIDLLNTGRADATLNAETAFYDYLNQHPEAPVKIVALSDSTTSSLIPVRKDNAKLLQAINEALDEMKSSGELAALSEKYFGSDITNPQ